MPAWRGSMRADECPVESVVEERLSGLEECVEELKKLSKECVGDARLAG